ncbi:BTAD domain-containing putative transcriptional regulator [Streptomyces sp. CB01881]|uniref:BTAD domain-containing putative transcriptional regulator n=1 Tax=Streptomyces sp. CB01881 TaxID=2078691 RepID=UPI000CDBDB85|nr:BTAD domain-containing putative transcriptional regulator [Streptomyces sp. CB01881]AUY53464.1 LuxR family transcriptional regulator [Streptomyces sp. CB01881]TYC69613.1 LuxR family transcriptional regulator [Streptomyces sp. CB01881]
MEAAIGGEGLALGRPQQRAVLALLLIGRGQVVSVDRLVDTLWPTTPVRQALASLHPYISNLRRVLEPGRPPRSASELLVSAPPGYAVRLPADAVDAWRFEAAVREARDAEPAAAHRRLTEALGWWRGPAYQEWADQEWAVPEVARLGELRLAAQELAAAAGLRAGRPGEVVPTAEELVRADPLREEGWRLLALAQWATGRQADALLTLRRARTAVVEELGLDPGPALVELEQAVLSGRFDVLRRAVPEHVRSGPVVAGATPAESVPDEAVSPEARFFGRQDELDGLHAVARAATRAGGVVLVSGNAGVGKTALLDRYAALLRADGWTVVTGRCPDDAATAPVGAWVEALTALPRLDPPPAPGPLDALLAAPPVDGLAPAEGLSPVDAVAARCRLHTEFRDRLTRAAARGPLAVVIDDLGRADAQTLALLGLAASLRGAPVLVVAAFRPDEGGQRLTPLLAELAGHDPHRLDLRGLPAPEVAALVRAVAGVPVAAEVIAALTEQSGGNPHHLVQAARLLGEEGAPATVGDLPSGLRAVLLRRLARRSAPERELLHLAVLCGGGEEETAVLLAAASSADSSALPVAGPTTDVPGAGSPSADSPATDLLAAGLLAETAPGRVRLAHPLLRELLDAELTAARRRALHGRLAEALERLRPEDRVTLARHAARSGEAGRARQAVDGALRAAERAERRLAHDVAAELIQWAIDAADVIPAPDAERAERLVGLLGRLLQAQVRAGAAEAALRTRDRAASVARFVGRDDLLAAAHAAWTEPTPWFTRPHRETDPRTVETLERLAARDDLEPAVTARLLQRMVEELAGTAPGRALEAAERQLRVARSAGDPQLLAAALTTMTRLMPHELQGERRGAVIAELRDLTEEHELPAYRWVCEHVDATIAAVCNDAEAVREHAERGVEIARRYGMPEAEATSTATLAMLAHARGGFDEAERLYGQVRARLYGGNAWHGADLYDRGLVAVRLGQGRVEELEPHMRVLYDTWGVLGGEAFAVVLALQGKVDEARAVRLAPVPAADHFLGVRLGARAKLACLLGDKRAAAELVPHLAPLQDQLGSAATAAFCTRPLALGLAEVYVLLGDLPSARLAYARAEEVALQWGADHLAEAARAGAAALPAARAVIPGPRTEATFADR